MSIDHSLMKLGKEAPKYDARNLKFANYVPSTLPHIPMSVDWTKGYKKWGMMANDVLGDCTVAAVGHAVQLYCWNGWAKSVGGVIVPDQEVIDYYSKWDGYVPGDPRTDRGGVEIDVLNRWRKDTFHNHQLLGYAQVDTHHLIHVQQAISIFGCAYIGIALPLSAQHQAVWDVTDPTLRHSDSKPGSWGGHAVIVPKYDLIGPTCITWGQEKKMTWRFWAAYVDEAYALLHRGWYPSGFSMDALEADLKLVTN